MEMSESTDDPIASDVTVVAEDQEGTIELLQAKLEKLKSLLLKAKMSISEYKHKAEDLEERLEEQHLREDLLMTRVEELETRKPPSEHEVVSVLARVRVEGVAWLLLRTVGSSGEWYREDQVQVPAQALPEVVDCLVATPTAVALQIAGVVKQYEERQRKLAETCQHTQDTLKDTQTVYRDLQQAYREQEAQVRSLSELLLLVTESKALHKQLNDLMEDSAVLPEALGPIQKGLIRLIQAPAYQLSQTEAVRVHICDLHKALSDLARRLLRFRKEACTQEDAWKSTCDALVKEKEDLKAALASVRADLSKRTQDFEATLKSEHAENEGKMDALQAHIELLEADLKKAVNVPYLRHVFTQFLTTGETDVQLRLLHVIATILEFTKEDIAGAQKPPKGVLARWLG